MHLYFLLLRKNNARLEYRSLPRARRQMSTGSSAAATSTVNERITLLSIPSRVLWLRLKIPSCLRCFLRMVSLKALLRKRLPLSRRIPRDTSVVIVSVIQCQWLYRVRTRIVCRMGMFIRTSLRLSERATFVKGLFVCSDSAERTSRRASSHALRALVQKPHVLRLLRRDAIWSCQAGP